VVHRLDNRFIWWAPRECFNPSGLSVFAVAIFVRCLELVSKLIWCWQLLPNLTKEIT